MDQVKDMSIQDLEMLILNCINKVFKSASQEDEFLTLSEASSFSKRSRQTIKLWEKKGLIKSNKVSERISYYSKQDLKKILQGENLA